MSGYAYGEREPREPCPYCGTICHADFVDIGVGFQQCGPYHCQRCGASETSPYDEGRELTDSEKATGWYEPGTPAGSAANVDEDGRIIPFWQADNLYREAHGVAARYDKRGNYIG